MLAIAALLGAAAARAADPAAPGIDATNVHRLQLSLSLRTGHVGAESSAPANAHGTLFVLTPFPPTLFAIDPAAADGHRVKWQYTPKADRLADGLSCCDRSAHGPVVEGGRVFFTTLDGHVIALDAATGAVRFDAALADPKAGETLAGAPLVAEGRVFVGSAGDDFGARGWIAALDAESGRTIWKRYSTGPDSDVGIGAEFKPFYAALRGEDLGRKTWPPAAWQQGGGSVAGTLLHDARGHAVIHGTGHPAPWNPDQRTGDDRWTAGLFSRDAGTGAARWFVALNPHDPYAFRDAGSDLLIEAAWQGEMRSLVVHPDANGVLYVVDRATGQILAADAVTESVVSGFDTASGQTRYAPSKGVKVDRQTRRVCPSWMGAFGGGAGALPGGDGMVVLPVSRVCMDIEPRPANYIKGTPYVGANVRLLLDRPNGGSIVGWSLAQRRAVWQAEEKLPVLGGALATESGLVFYGTLDGRLKALDGRSGKLLWQFKCPSSVMSRPTVFRGSDGREYLAVVAGSGRIHGMSRVEALDPRDEGAGAGLAGLLRRLPPEDDPSGTLLVFRLP